MEEQTNHWVVKEIHAAKDEPAKKMSINQWDEDDRPREKMLKKGASAMIIPISVSPLLCSTNLSSV